MEKRVPVESVVSGLSLVLMHGEWAVLVAVALTLLRFELAPDPFKVPVPTPRIVLMSNNGIHLHLRKLL